MNLSNRLIKGKMIFLAFILIFSSTNQQNFNEPLPIKTTNPKLTSSKQYFIDFIKNPKSVYADEAYFKVNDSSILIKEGEFTIENVYLEPINRRKGLEKRKMVFPGNDKSDALVNIKALIQNYFSRKLLYYPGSIVQTQILTLAKRVTKIILAIEKESNKFALLEQLLNVTPSTNAKLFDQKTYSEIAEFIKKMSLKPAALIDYKDIITMTSTFCGINDIFATPRTNDRRLVLQIKTIIKENLDFKEYPSFNSNENYSVLERFNYSKTGLLRMEQKIRVETNVAMKGLFGYGDIIDNFFFTEIKEKLKPLRFHYCHYDIEKLKGITEPLACGPSGSLASTIYMWNNFLGVDTNKLIDDSVTESDIKKNIYYHPDYVQARVAAVIAVYLSVGFHSAAEVIETYYSLIGVDLRKNIYHRFYNPFLYTDFSDMRQYNATDKIIELLNAFSSNRENLSNKEYTNKFSKDYIFEEMNKYRLEDK